jgi:hypothetical protein
MPLKNITTVKVAYLGIYTSYDASYKGHVLRGTAGLPVTIIVLAHNYCKEVKRLGFYGHGPGVYS